MEERELIHIFFEKNHTSDLFNFLTLDTLEITTYPFHSRAHVSSPAKLWLWTRVTCPSRFTFQYNIFTFYTWCNTLLRTIFPHATRRILMTTSLTLRFPHIHIHKTNISAGYSIQTSIDDNAMFTCSIFLSFLFFFSFF